MSTPARTRPTVNRTPSGVNPCQAMTVIVPATNTRPNHPDQTPLVGGKSNSRPMGCSIGRAVTQRIWSPYVSHAALYLPRLPIVTILNSPTAAGTSSAASVLADATSSDASLRRFLHGLPGVDQVGAEGRAAGLGTRSIKTTAKSYAIDLAIRMVDLTTLEGNDTPGKVRALCSKAVRPDPADPSCPSVAAVCVYPDMVPFAVQALGTTRVHVAAVATAFPSGRAAMDIKLADTRNAVDAGAHEIDMVIDRGAFLSGRYLEVYDEIVQVKEACARAEGRDAHLK